MTTQPPALTPSRPRPLSMAVRAQWLLLHGVAALPRRLASRMFPAPPVPGATPLDPIAGALAGVSARAGIRLVVDDDAIASRAALRAGHGSLRGPRLAVDAWDTVIDGGADPLAARLYRPREIDSPTGLLVFAHGGGWMIGDLDVYDYPARFLAHHGGVQVLSVDYRLAPEHPFPAGLDDLTAAYRWAVRHAASLGVDPARVALGGDSAGATLSAAATTTLRSDPHPPVMQLLLYPATDLTSRHPSRDRFGEGFMLTDHDIGFFYDAYAGDADRGDPRLSPLLGNLAAEQAPTYIATAGYDPLGDEGRDYARALAEKGAMVTHHDHADLLHGYLAFAGLGGRFAEASRDAAAALRAALG